MDKVTYYDLIQPAVELVAKKHKDYEAGGVALGDYFPLGHASHVQMMHVKCQRLVALSKAEKTPDFESVKDTVLDLINYGVFYLAFLESQDGKSV